MVSKIWRGLIILYLGLLINDFLSGIIFLVGFVLVKLKLIELDEFV